MTPKPFTLSFGKYKGKQVSEVPTEYLLWVRNYDRQSMAEVERVLRERKELAAPTIARAEEVITAGKQSLAKKYHPDCGGTNQEMQEVNVAADTLLKLAKTI